VDVCTVIAKNYIAHARVLAHSFARHHPVGRFSVLVIDEVDGYIDPEEEPFELLAPGDIGCDEFDLMASRYDVLELATAVKPWLLRYLLSRSDRPITYLDPDILVCDSLVRLEQLGREHGLVLTPHNTVPIPFDGERPTQVDIMIAGVFNLGYITVAAGPQIDRLIDWWSERLRRDCRVDPIYGYFVDQRWMDLIPGLMDDYAVVRDPEFNVAAWNLHARTLEHDGERYTVDGRPLAFFHFSGFDPYQPEVLSRHQTRVKMAEQPALARICREYSEALMASGHAVAQRWPYSYGSLHDGTPFGSVLRRLFQEGEDRGDLHSSPLQAPGHDAFVNWLSGQEEGVPRGMTRLLAGLYRQRRDLRNAFPDIAGADLHQYLTWARQTGIPELGLPPQLLPAPRSMTVPRRAATAPLAHPPADPAPPGVNVVGNFQSELGVGQAARQVVSALDTAGVPLLPLDAHTTSLKHMRVPFAQLDHGEAQYPLNLICIEASALTEFAKRAGDQFFHGRYSIGLWFWELSSPPPDEWRDALALLDEVWAPSRHVARTISVVSPVPVVRVPLPIEMPPTPRLSRGTLGLPDTDFIFLFLFDYQSGFERENPLALVEAFRLAFEPGSGATLVIEAINADSDASHRARLHDAAADRPDVRLIEHYLAPEMKNALMAACDCYASLHRAEAFGLTIAEAMFLGKPVIATGYSGNADFMTAWNSFPVDWQLVPIGADAPPYPAEGDWAEPSVEHAAALMREVFDNRSNALARGRRAADEIRRSHSAQAAGEHMRGRLQYAGARARSEGRLAFAAGVADAHALGLQVEPGASPPRVRSLPRGVARRAVLRAIKPFTAHQVALNNDVLRRFETVTHRQVAAQSDRLRGERAATREREGLHAHVTELRHGLDELRALQPRAVERIDDVARRLERIEADAQAIPFMEGKPFGTTDDPIAGVVVGYTTANGARHEPDYRAFEDVFRGSEDFIRDRQRRYLPIIGRRQPVIDFGCGRGELLDLLRGAGLSCIGVDSDASMIARCREKGHNEVVHQDALEYMKQLADDSLGVIFAAQVIEHLSHEQLNELLGLARRKLAPDGILIAETVNPHSPAALKTFWVDLTHQRPIFPEVALELCREAGFRSAYVFHPNGTGDVERDRFSQGEFAVVASLHPDSVAGASSNALH
jgi:SAM-dependent methyltransferase/glycosyltransferase involved in cell wall biosynthesis